MNNLEKLGNDTDTIREITSQEMKSNRKKREEGQ